GADMNGRVTVNGHDGDDVFVVDDTSALMTLDGGNGNDRFQIGQIFEDHPNPEGTAVDGYYASGVRVGDEIRVTKTTLGYLSYGNSEAMVIYGGAGNDEFIVYSNKGLLRMEGEDGNDNFVIRAFIAGDDIEVRGGNGDDNIEYNINAPVSIDGGSGYNTVTVLGTEANDNFVITEDGVFGAGLNIGFDNIQRVRVDGLEGDDTFYVLSTRFDVVTELIGGVGSDTFIIGGNVTGRVVAADPEGRSSLVGHGTGSLDPDYDSLLADGLPVIVADESRGAVVVEQPGGHTSVVEGGPASSWWLSLALPADGIAEGTLVTLTVSAAMSSTNDRNRTPAGGRSAETVLLSLDDETYGQAINVDFVFEDGQWTPRQEIFVKAPEDDVVEGTRRVTVSYLAQVQTPGDEALPEVLEGLLKQPINNTMVTVYDANQGDLVFDVPNERLQLIEGDDITGQDGSFTLRLSTPPQPGETVTVTLDLSAFGDRVEAVGGTTLTFTADDWDQPQVVTLKAVDNDRIENRLDGRVAFTIETSGGENSVYADADPGTVRVTVFDNDSASLVVQQSDGRTLVTQQGGTDSY
ncbi:MAG: hypothetical protein ACRC3F_03725, partial [Billgrantia desiderata]